MTIILEEAARPSHATFAAGMASIADIARAGRDSMLYVDNANSAHEALDRALEERIRGIHAATGQKLENPLRQADSLWRRSQLERPTVPNPFTSFSRTGRDLRSLSDMREQYLEDFETRLFELDERFNEIPQARQAIGAGRPVADDATRIARQTDARLAQFLASRPGAGKWGPLLAGGLAGALNDPVTIASLALGAGPSAARTVAGRILSVAGKEALINAGTEAVIQPNVQAWREKAGLDHGLDEAVRNVLFAGALGGVFGGGVGAAAEGLRRLAKPRDIDRAAERLRQDEGRLTEPARAILANDGLKAADSLGQIREHLPPAARGAIDAAETARLTDEQRPPAASNGYHDAMVSRADEAIRLPDVEAWPGFEPDPAQIERVVRAIAGEAAAAETTSGSRSLLNFLIDRGGVREFRGELGAIGATEVSRPFRGRLVKEGGQSLDYAREAAAEAGFFDAKFGEPERAVAKSTVADLLEEIEVEIRSGPSEPLPSMEEAARAGLEGTVDELARLAGPAVDDAVLERAARLSIDEGIEPFDALERVLVREESNVRYVKGFRDTRGDGEQFHGGPREIGGFDEGHYTSLNYYGQGFYTTDAIDIANGYANRRGAEKPSIYRVREVQPVKLLDMEKPIPDWLVGKLDEWSDMDAELLEIALDEQPRNVRELYDEIRAYSRSVEMSADEVQELFDAFRARMEERGFGGLEHTGGLRTNNEPHRVRIYFEPQDQIAIEEVDLSDFRLNVGERTGEPLPGWSDEELLAVSENRGTVPEPGQGLDDPGTPQPDDITIDELTELPEDMLVPTEDGLVSASELLGDIERGEHLLRVTQACRV